MLRASRVWGVDLPTAGEELYSTSPVSSRLACCQSFADKSIANRPSLVAISSALAMTRRPASGSLSTEAPVKEGFLGRFDFIPVTWLFAGDHRMCIPWR